jgi:hypothetical protein
MSVYIFIGFLFGSGIAAIVFRAMSLSRLFGDKLSTEDRDIVGRTYRTTGWTMYPTMGFGAILFPLSYGYDQTHVGLAVAAFALVIAFVRWFDRYCHRTHYCRIISRMVRHSPKISDPPV